MSLKCVSWTEINAGKKRRKTKKKKYPRGTESENTRTNRRSKSREQ
jgi:hypothetical protein